MKYVSFTQQNSKLLITRKSKVENRIHSQICKPSSVLSRVKDFLPIMKEAELALEQELQVKSPTELDIESIDDDGPFIEMNLALVETQSDSSEESSEENDEDFCRDSDGIATHEIDGGHVTEENFVITKPVKGHVKPVIEEVKTLKTDTTPLRQKTEKIATKKTKRRRKRR